VSDRQPRFPLRTLVLVVAALLTIGLAVFASGVLAPAPTTGVIDLEAIEQLQRQFNRDRGEPRLLLLLSPT
jgi:hypothetical protein